MSSPLYELFCICTLENNSYATESAADPEAKSALFYE